MFLGRLMAGARREEGADLRAASHEHVQLIDEITQNLSKLQESARHQFIKINVGGYRWYHDDSFAFAEPATFRNSRGVPRIENWKLSDLVSLKEALDQDMISVECKRKRRVDDDPATDSNDREKGRVKRAVGGGVTNSDDGTAKLLQERDALQKMVTNANKDVNNLRISLANAEAERETVKHQLWAMEAPASKDDRKYAEHKADQPSQDNRFAELDTVYEKWKANGAPEYGFLSRILKNDYELLVAAGRFFEGAEDTSAPQTFDSPHNGRPLPLAQSPEMEAESFRADKSIFNRSKSLKRSDGENEISSADTAFIMTCLQNTSGGTLSIDIPAVAKTLSYTNPKSVTNKIAFMRKKYSIPITGARPKGDGSDDGRRTSLPKSTPGPKPKSRASNGHLQTPIAAQENLGNYHQWKPEKEIVAAAPPIPMENTFTEWRAPPAEDHKGPSRTPLPSTTPDDSIRVQTRTPLPSTTRQTDTALQVPPSLSASSDDIKPKIESPVKRGFVAVNGHFDDNPSKRQHVEPPKEDIEMRP